MKKLICVGMILIFVAAGVASAATLSVEMIFEDPDWSGMFALDPDSAYPEHFGPGITLTRYDLVGFEVSGRGFVWGDDDSVWTGSVLGDDFGGFALSGDFTDDDSGESMQGNAALGPGLPISPVIFLDCGHAFPAPCFYPYEARGTEGASNPIPEPSAAVLFGIGILPVALTVSKRRH